LIRRFIAGDREAFDELVIRHQKQVFATAYRMVGNAEIAEDIAQETFIRAFKSLRSFKKKARFGTWLYRITMNLCYDELKRRQREIEARPEAGPATAETPIKKMAAEEKKMWLEEQIGLLPIKQKMAVILRIFNEMPFKEVGQAIGCSTNSAKVNYRHALLKLKEAMARSGEAL